MKKTYKTPSCVAISLNAELSIMAQSSFRVYSDPSDEELKSDEVLVKEQMSNSIWDNEW